MLDTVAPELRGVYDDLMFKFLMDNINDTEIEQLQVVSEQLQAKDIQPWL